MEVAIIKVEYGEVEQHPSPFQVDCEVFFTPLALEMPHSIWLVRGLLLLDLRQPHRVVAIWL